YHGPAELYDLAGAATVATLYADATTPTSHPAVTLRDVGAAGGQFAVFAYDLARSAVLTRQGNPDWAAQDRDGDGRIRTNDLFVGDTPGVDDWIDLDKVAIPQADEQQRLLANLILHMNQNSMPLPRFWYFPNGHKAVVLLTEDNHGTTWSMDRFEQHLVESPPGCVLEDWECVRSSSYIYATNPMTDAQAAYYDALGFEISIHSNTGCDTPWPDLPALQAIYDAQFPPFVAKYASIPSPLSERAHCVTWADYDSRPIVQYGYGIRLDVTYYYENVTAWQIDAHPGMFTGSGMPMRFTDFGGGMIDVFQATTQMTDESGQTYPHTIDALLDGALGPDGYYGAFTANMHADYEASNGSYNAPVIVAAAQARDVPIITSRQMLNWLDARNASSWQNLTWDGSTLLGDVVQAPNALHLEGMLPSIWSTGAIAEITRDGLPIEYRIEEIKGISYAIFGAGAGSYAATYEEDLTPPLITDVQHAVGAYGTATITWDTDEPADSRVEYGTDSGDLDLSADASALVLAHTLQLPMLDPGTTYYYRVVSSDYWDNTATEPPVGAFSFTTPPPVCFADIEIADFAAGAFDAGVHLAATADGELVLAPEIGVEFLDGVLPAGWSAPPADPGGIAVVAGGLLTLDGARAHPDAVFAYPTGDEVRSLEFVATFGAAINQHAGFGLTLQEYPYAIFSTYGDGATLRAHTRLDVATGLITSLGAGYLGAPHLYRIEWRAAAVDYFIDGTPVIHHDLSPAQDLHPVAFDRYLGGPTLAVDWMRMSPYATDGEFTSRVFDALSVSTWGAAFWTGAEPAGTGLELSYRLGDTPVPDGSWTAYTLLPASGSVIGSASQYFQYRLVLSTADPLVTPRLDDFALNCELGDDVTPPLITELAVAPGTSGATAVVTWLTNEPADSRIGYGTAPGNLDTEVSDAALVTSHSLQLTGLAPGTLYHFRVTSTDPADNAATEPPLLDSPATFLTPYPPCLAESAVADFAGGDHAGTYVSESQDGEVILEPTVGAEFSGTDLPEGWTLIAEAPGGSTTVMGGTITVDGTRPGTVALFAPGRSLEFRGTFDNVTNQHVGFGVTFGEFSWAIFSTGGSGSGLKARTRMDDVYLDETLPSVYQGAPHDFRIDWNVGSVDYYIDGELAAHHDIDVTVPLRPMISDTTVDGIVLAVDWLRMTPFATAGSYVSAVYDAGQTVIWDAVDWLSTEPPGTSVLISARCGHTPLPDASWTDYGIVPGPGGSLGVATRYVQYRADLVSDDDRRTPVLEEVTITCGATTAVDPELAVPDRTRLHQNYPNPFNPSTTLRFSLASRGDVTLKLYAVDGRLVRTLVAGELAAGHHEVVWDGTDQR
ncbi:fibronectin type III domain-containing protein, partial [bacterium]|nr:fibronectin type III domain-containing protein [bacterium]